MTERREAGIPPSSGGASDRGPGSPVRSERPNELGGPSAPAAQPPGAERRTEAFDLSTTYAHLGLGARVEPLPDFEWTPEYLGAYTERTASDGNEGRLVVLMRQDASWDSWERHPAGDELVVLLSGRADLIQEIDGEEHVVPLTPGMAVVNPPGVWHTATVHEPGQALFITAGRGTETRPR